MKVTVVSTTAFPEPESGVTVEAMRTPEIVSLAVLIASNVPSLPRVVFSEPPEPP